LKERAATSSAVDVSAVSMPAPVSTEALSVQQSDKTK
jgi:hypothetical protein